MNRPTEVPPPERVLLDIIRTIKVMPESRLAVLTNFLISAFILSLVYTGDVSGLVGTVGVVAINGSTSGILYAFAQTLEEAEEKQQHP